MATKKVKHQELFDVSQFSHFYAPQDAVKFLVDLTQPKPAERVLSIGLYPQSLNFALGSGVSSQVIEPEQLNQEQIDSLSNQLFDVIVCAPTFGVLSPGSNRPSEEIWLKWSLEHLSENGRLAIIVPIGLLSNYSQEPVRQFLLEKGGLRAVIEMPSGWAQGTAIQASILYSTAEFHPERSIKMFRFFGLEQIPWDILVDEIHKPEPKLPTSVNGTAYSVSASQLTSARLDAKYYDPAFNITSPDPSFLPTKLVEIVEIRSGDRFLDDDVLQHGVPFVQVKNINLDGTLDLRGAKTIKPSVAINSRSYSEPDDILISTAGTIGKVALVPAQSNVCIDTSLRRLRILDKNRVLPEYLELYLRSNTAKLQFARWFSGSVIRVLSTPNLEQLVVFLPELSKQQELVQLFQEHVHQRIDELLAAFPDANAMSLIVTPAVHPPIANPTTTERPLGEIIQEEFPFPIARAFTVFKNSSNESPVNQLKKLINVSEAIIYYLYGILVADQLRRVKFDDPELKTLLIGSITDYSMDKRLKYLFRFIKLSNADQNARLFIPKVVTAELGVCSEIHNNIRNKFSHGDPPDAWCKKAVAV